MTSGSQIRRTVGRAALTVATLGKECWIVVRRRMGTPKKGRWMGGGFDRGLRSQGDARIIAGERVSGVTGKPFNFVGAATLQLMLAQQSKLTPGELIWVGGDIHLYLNHLDVAREQLRRDPRPFPTMSIVRDVPTIDDYQISDFAVENYDPHPAIKADVAV